MARRDDDDGESIVRTIGEAVDGQWLKAAGKVVRCDGEPLVAPITGRPCVCFDAAAWSYIVTYPDTGVSWASSPNVLTRSLRGTPFVIEDGTGEALVDPRGAFVHVTLDHWRGGRKGALSRRPFADPSFMRGVPARPDLEVAEGVIEIGELVLVSGLVQRAPATDDGLYRASADRRLRIVGSSDRPAIVSDRRAELVRAGVVVPLAPPTREMSPPGRTRQHVSGRRIVVPDE